MNRQHYTPDRPGAAGYMTLVALSLWLGILPAVVYLTSH